MTDKLQELRREFDKHGKRLDELTKLIQEHPKQGRYRREFDTVFDAQAEITNQIVELLRAQQ